MPAVTRDPCACGQPVEQQHLRHLTKAEYDALPEAFRPIDGYAVTPVFTCWDCAPAPICEHPEPAPVPCPSCGAQDEQECAKADGTPRLHPHPARAAAQPQPGPCLHAHREDCDHRACRCGPGDEPPARVPRIVGASGETQQLADLGFPPAMLPAAAAWLAEHRIDPSLVRGDFRTGLTQTGESAMLFDYATAPDDGHGHEVVELRIVPVGGPTP